jgi:hypothetical protein
MGRGDLVIGDIYVETITLGDRLHVPHPETKANVIGKVVQLTLMANGDFRITLQLDTGFFFDIDRDPGDHIDREL